MGDNNLYGQTVALSYNLFFLKMFCILFFAVGSVSEILQFPIAHNTYDDSYGIFWTGSLFSCSCFQGTADLLILYNVYAFLYVLITVFHDC